MILHISCDDQFVRYVDKQFMEGNTSSRLVVCDYNVAPEFAKHAPHMEYIQAYSDDFRQLLQSLCSYTGIIFHGLFGRWATDILDAVPNDVKIGWVCWDAEVFARPEREFDNLMPITRMLRRLKYAYSYLKNGNKSHPDYFVPKDRFKRINYCLCDMPQEAIESNRYFGTQMEWLPYNYYTIEETVGDLHDARVKGNNIFLGNACRYGNNHIDALWQLRGLIGKSQKVITPLSYGNMGLQKHVLRAGRLLLGDAFDPLVDYMPLETYNAKMLSCSVMIQNHYTPQALGNILVGLWLGMRVYLSKRNVTYDFLRDLGVFVYTVEDDLNRQNPHLFDPLPGVEVARNREVLEGFYGEKATKHKVEIVIQKMIK